MFASAQTVVTQIDSLPTDSGPNSLASPRGDVSVPTGSVTAQSNRRALDLALCGGCFGRSRSSYRAPEGLRPALDNPDSRAKIRCIVTQVTATQNGRSAWLRQEKLGPESVG